MFRFLPGLCDKHPIREYAGVLAVILFLLAFFAFGIDLIVHPRRHMNAHLRRGGEMLREWNELQMQLCGLGFCCASAWMLYKLIQSFQRACVG
jgi:hypothetical protein